MNTIFSERLLYYRNLRGYSSQQMADKAGISKAAYNFYEIGRSEPKINMLVILARILNVTVNDLVYEESIPQTETIFFDDDDNWLFVLQRLLSNGKYRIAEWDESTITFCYVGGEYRSDEIFSSPPDSSVPVWIKPPENYKEIMPWRAVGRNAIKSKYDFRDMYFQMGIYSVLDSIFRSSEFEQYKNK